MAGGNFDVILRQIHAAAGTYLNAACDSIAASIGTSGDIDLNCISISRDIGQIAVYLAAIFHIDGMIGRSADGQRVVIVNGVENIQRTLDLNAVSAGTGDGYIVQIDSGVFHYINAVTCADIDNVYALRSNRSFVIKNTVCFICAGVDGILVSISKCFSCSKSYTI